MANNKKSFVLYCDLINTVSKLPNEKAGELFKHLLEYVNDLDPKTDDVLLSVAFEPIKQQLKRDLVKWETQQTQRIEAGKKSAEVRKRNATSVNERSVSSTVNVSDSVTVNDNVIKEERFNVFWTKYPKKVAKPKCLDKWMKLKQPDIDKILSTIDAYISYKPFPDYTHPNPMTYLNQQRWNDEIGSTEEPKKIIDPLVEYANEQNRLYGNS